VNIARLLWRWSWCLTLPICIAFVYWLWSTSDHYATFGVRYNSLPAKVSIVKTGRDTFQRLRRRVELALTPGYIAQRNRKLEKVNIFIPESHIAKLNQRLPHSGMEYVKGSIFVDGEIKKMSARYRGDTYVHWGPPKRSLRIKTKKKYLYRGMRRFNLLAPKGKFMMVNYSSYQLAEILGLIVPKSEMVDVILNGRPRGIHVMVEQFEELTLRNNNRMPGDLYSGELFAKDRYEGVSSYVFEHPGLWGKVAANNHFELTSNQPLERLIGLLNAKPDKENSQALSELLDLEAWGKFAAFETLSQTFHFDHAHNWRLYYDPWRHKFEPLVWDPIGWVSPSSFRVPLVADVSRTKLHKALYRNSQFILQKQKALQSFFDHSQDEVFLDKIDTMAEKLISSVMYDPHILDPWRTAKDVRAYRSRIENVFEKVRSEFLEEDGEVTYSSNLTSEGEQKLRILVEGRRPVEELVLVYAEKVSRPDQATVSFWVNGEKNERDVSGAVQSDGSRLIVRIPLVVKYRPKMRSDVNITVQETSPAYYELSLKDISNNLVEVLVSRGNPQHELARESSDLERISFVDSFDVVSAIPTEQIELWQGDITLSGINHVRNKVIVESGTNVFLEAGASIIFHNRVTALGTDDLPVRFVRKTGEQLPWGTIALQGQMANGSRFDHCEFRGGSGFKGDMFEYSGMFSVHDVSGLSINNCRFQDSFLVDDMMHAVYSELRISNTEFNGALFDALDLDISQARIVDSTFINNGNDSIDLMTSDLSLLNSYIAKSGDKGVSVGEGSRLLAINNTIENNAIGVQSKDGSVATLYNVNLVANKNAVDAYKKNWRYASGGYLYIYKSYLAGNNKMVTADKQSAIQIYDTAYDQEIVEERKKKRIMLHKTASRMGSNLKALGKKLWRYPSEVEQMRGFNQKDWELVNVLTRGSEVAVEN